MQSKKRKKAVKKSVEKKEPMEFWKEIVKVWFDFCEDKFKAKPSFDSVSGKHLKLLIADIKTRAIDDKAEWTSSEAQLRLKGFLIGAFKDKWLREHFMLKNILANRQQIFFQKDISNGRASNEVVGKTIVFDRP